MDQLTATGQPIGRTMTDENIGVQTLLKKIKGYAFMVNVLIEPSDIIAHKEQVSIYTKLSFVAAREFLNDLLKKEYQLVNVTWCPGYAPMVFFNCVVR